MKKILSLSLALIMAMALVGCQDDEQTNGVYMGSYTGVVTNQFTEGSGEDTANVISIETDDGETVHFTVIDSTDFVGASTVELGDNVVIDCECYTDSDYHPILEIRLVHDWGITLTATDVTTAGLTIVCEQVDGEQQGELQTGSPYWLEIFKDNTWQVVPYLPLEYDVAWTAEAWSISLNDKTEWTVDWEWLYGELPSGSYRIGKSVMDFIETGSYEEQSYYAEFEIE